MRLSDLIPHTSTHIGVPETHVTTVTRALRPAGLLSTAGKGPRAADMTVDDKINLLLGVCGVEVANRAAEHVRIWRRLVRIDESVGDSRFAFTRAQNVKDFLVGLITEDLNGGALDAWVKETSDEFDRAEGASVRPRHQVTLDFYVDAFALTLAVSRYRVYSHDRTEADTIEIRFIQPAPDLENPFVSRKPGAQLIRRLDAETIRGWGTCLTGNAQ